MSVGMKSKSMRAGCARTYFIDPSKRMQEMYDIVSKTHDALIRALGADGSNTISAACTAARSVLIASPNLPTDAKLHKDFGCGIGPRTSDKHLRLTTKNTTVLVPGVRRNLRRCVLRV
jgi:Xaa-Pro aminopeptidase